MECFTTARASTGHSTPGSGGAADSFGVERNQFVDQTVEVEEVDLGDALDLPADSVALPVTPLVLGRSVEQKMIRVDVDLDAPTHRGNSQVEPHTCTAR